MRHRNKFAMENVQRAFMKRPVGALPELNYKEKCTMLNLESLFLRCAKANVVFFNSLITVDVYISAPQFRNKTSCSLRNAKLVITTGTASAGIGANVLIGKYSILCGNPCPKKCDSCYRLPPLSKRSPETADRNNPHSYALPL